jgi:predicted Zn-dependent protease
MFGDASGLIAIAAEGGRYLLTQGFSREHEADADDVGWGYLVDADIDPRGMIEFFEKLHAQTEEAGMDEMEEALSFLSTHPATSDRISELESRYAELGRTDGWSEPAIDFSAFQDKLQKVLNR